MPLFLLTNWRWLAPLALAIVLGGGWAVTYLRLEHLQLTDSQALERASEHARELEARYANQANEIEEAHDARSKAIEDAFDANTKLAHSRGMFVHSQCPAAVSKNSNPGSPPDENPKARLSEGDGGFLNAFARDCARDANVGYAGQDFATSLEETK